MFDFGSKELVDFFFCRAKVVAAGGLEEYSLVGYEEVDVVHISLLEDCVGNGVHLKRMRFAIAA